MKPSSSSNPALVPTNNIVFGGSGSNRTVSVTPAPDAHGTTTLSLTIGDGTNSTTTNFVLVVRPVNDVPIVTSVGDQIIDEDANEGLLQDADAWKESARANVDPINNGRLELGASGRTMDILHQATLRLSEISPG